MSIEVERKFLCSANTLKTLKEIGVCAGQRQFHDQYFDTPQFHLTLRDMWLRKRTGCWELKCPTTRVKGAEESEASAQCSRYKEITNLSDIKLKLKEVLKDIGEDVTSRKQLSCVTESCQHEIDSVQDQCWARSMNLFVFAEFTTVRQTFTLKEDGVQVDLDEADFGYRVGEIEVLIPEGGDMQAAMDKIERTAKKLGLTGDRQVDGKMSVYLQVNYPEHYARLLSEHIL
ncbi:thiamine-triphosphatase isoform X2 [Dunckerocampus dactyliophorus]|uniref:thiamine-triphosphatase isoform X2 n=1 Tax=Dunckerocampus dactyliophorus TaxID=161453 RepID=UPI002406CF70|nr:thiamine-triphosphatase isoform X2 [Dunckerocampus dactyliophorus]XP_054621907.1 thiamine-triphosphatase isoform X2 [Dunckerocampus dactyliophorus]